MYRQLTLAVFFAFTIYTAALGQKQTVHKVADAKLGNTRNVHVCGGLFLAGQPTADDLQVIQSKGIKRIVTLRQDGEIDWDEQSAAAAARIEFVKVPFRGPDSLTDEVFDRIRKLLGESEQKPTLLHCGSANRVGAVWFTYRVLDQGVPVDQALREAKQIGLSNPGYEQKATSYVLRKQAKPKARSASVRPGINDNFLKADLNVDEWLARFEIESREVFSARDEVLSAMGVEPGMRVADVGAGTGFYTRMFSAAVGDEGWVFAVDIVPKFIQHISSRANEDELENVSTVLCSDDSVTLPPRSIDVAFICDTYHHFEYPQATLASIHKALRPGGLLFVIDFERIPGETREWLMNHVRAGKQGFRGEIELAGFEFVKEERIEGFSENYFLRFARK